MSLLIGIGHKKQRGKDTAANRLVDTHNFIRVSWADSLKESARIIFGFTDAQLYGDLKEVVDPYWGITPREALQQLGTDACRDNIDSNIWVKSAWIKVQKIWAEDPDIGIVIPDVRFENEANFIREQGGLLWRVDRNIEDEVHSMHSSETALNDYQDWDLIIANNGSLNKLYRKVDAGLEQIKMQKTRSTNVLNTRKARSTQRTT